MKNYDAWKINPNDFYKEQTLEGKIKFLVRFGILAPSSHNTQPWKFKIKNNALELYADFSRRLPHSDETGRLMYIALGCAAENIKIAADYYGLAPKIEYNAKLSNSLPEYILKIDLGLDAATFEKPLKSKELLDAVLNRASFRDNYLRRVVPQSFLNELMTLANSDAAELGINFYTSIDQKQSLAEIVGEGMKNKMRLREFREELADWVRSNITRKCDGMPGSGHNLNLIKSILAPFVLRHINVSNAEKKKAVRKVKNFPAVCLISSATDNAFSWIKTGEILERLLLRISSRRLGASIMAAPIEDIGARKKLGSFILKPLPQVFFGFGYVSKEFPHSPRRSVEAVLIQ